MSFVNIFDNKGVVKRTKELNELLREVKQCDSEEQQKSIIEKIVALIMRSRLLCRQYKNKPLTGIYEEIYQQVYLLMIERMTQQKSHPNFEAVLSYRWLNETQLQTFREVLDDRRLKQLALAAQKQPPNSALRSYALTNLIKAIEISQKLCHPHTRLFTSNVYSLIHEEAVAKTMIHVCLKIDQYDPQRGSKKFMNWVNFKLDKTILAYYQNFNYSPIGKPISLSQVEIFIHKKAVPKKADLLYKCIEKDSQGIFKDSYIGDNPQANFKEIALRKLSNKTFKEIAEEFDSSVSTISAFYKRNCQKFRDILKQEIEAKIDS